MLDVLKQAFVQGQKLAKLHAEADSVVATYRQAADRVFFSLQDSFTFQQGQNVVQTLVFNVPRSEDFFATRFVLYPFVRRVSNVTLPAGTTEDLVFRPTIWTFQATLPLVARCALDAVVELTTTTADQRARRYQNAAFTTSQAFGGYTSITSRSAANVMTFDRSESPAALVFDPEWHFEKGSTLSARVTPSFSGERDVAYADNLINEYRIVGVLEGFKRAR